MAKMIELHSLHSGKVFVAASQILYFKRQTNAHLPKLGTEVELECGNYYLSQSAELFLRQVTNYASFVEVMTFDATSMWVNTEKVQEVRSVARNGGPGTDILISGRAIYVLTRYEEVLRLLQGRLTS